MIIETLKAKLEKVLWEDGESLPRWRRALLGPARILYAVVRDLAEGQINLRAMSLVYTTLLSMVPLLAITFSVLKGFGVHNQIEPLLLHAFEPLGDQGAEIAEKIIGFVNNMQVGVLGSVGLGLLLFTVVSLMQKIERALNDIWQVPQDRSWGERFSGYLSILMIGPVLVFSSVGLTASVGHSETMRAITEIEPFGALFDLASRLVPYLMIIIAFTVIYRMMPNTRVRLLSALIGGIIAGVLWKTVGWVFATYVVKSSNYPAIYSAFASLLMFMIWLYLAWVILLIGAAVAFYHQHPEYIGARRAQLLLSLDALERLALASAALIARRFYDGKPFCTLNELARRFRVPEKIVEGLLDVLQRCKFIKATADDPPAFMPARPPDAIGAGDLLRAVRHDGRGDNRMTTGLTAQPAVQRAADAAEAAMIEALNKVTLLDLALEGAALEDAAIAAAAKGEEAAPSDLLRAVAVPGNSGSPALAEPEPTTAAIDVAKEPAAGRAKSR